jgi:hypothetical protein
VLVENFRWWVLNSYNGEFPPDWIAEIHDLTTPGKEEDE